MKKQILMMAMILVSAVYSNAQDKKQKSPEQRAEHRVEMMTTKLSLSKDQSAKLKTVFIEAGKKFQSAKAKNTENKEAFRAEKKKIMSEKEAAIKQILTPEQFSQYLIMKEEQKAKHKAKHQQKKD